MNVGQPAETDEGWRPEDAYFRMGPGTSRAAARSARRSAPSRSTWLALG